LRRTRDIDADVIPACIETGTNLVAYSPLGRGMLTGSFKAKSEIADTDFRGTMQPPFSGDAYAANLELVEKIKSIADARGVTPAEVALAWIMAK